MHLKTISLFLGLIAFLGLAVIHNSEGAQWDEPSVIDPRDGSYWASIALDEDGSLHVAYLYEGEDFSTEVVYAKQDDSDWDVMQLEELSPFSGSRPDIAIVDGDQPVVVYSTTENDPPVFAEYNGWLWQDEDLPAAEGPHGAPLVCVDPEGGYHVAICFADGSIQYFNKDGFIWESAIVSADALELTGLVCDSSCSPWIFFTDRDGNLKTATFTDEWETELVSAPRYGMIGMWDSVVASPSGGLRLAYLDGNPPISAALLYAERDSSGWQIEKLEDGGLWAQVALGASYSAQVTHVQSFLESTSTRHLANDGLAWRSEEVPIERSGSWSLASTMTAMTADSENLYLVYAGVDPSEDGSSALLFFSGSQEGPDTGVSAELSLNEDSFKMNETLILYAQVTTGSEAVDVEAKVWVEDPLGNVESMLGNCAIFTLSANTNEFITVLDKTFAGTEYPGDYTINARLIDPITGAELSLDSVDYYFSAF